VNAGAGVLAGGAAAAAWDRRLRRRVARAAAVDRASTWPARLAEVQPVLREGPLLGRTLAELVLDRPRPAPVPPQVVRQRRDLPLAPVTAPRAGGAGGPPRRPADGPLDAPAPAHAWSGSGPADVGADLSTRGRHVRDRLDPSAVTGLSARTRLEDLRRYVAGSVPVPSPPAGPRVRPVGVSSADPSSAGRGATRRAAADWFAARAAAVGERIGVAEPTSATAALRRTPTGGPTYPAVPLDVLAAGGTAPPPPAVPTTLAPRSAPEAPTTGGGQAASVTAAAADVTTPVPSSTARTTSTAPSGPDTGADHDRSDTAGRTRALGRLAPSGELPSAPDRERRSRPGAPAPEARIGRPAAGPSTSIDQHELERLVTRILDDAARRHGIEV
jgi:hypothetical protein